MYSYKTIADSVRTKIAVGACRFYASLSSCRSEEEARSFLSRVKEELPGATHHAYAYRLGIGDALLARCDDDGEPAGTAGPPMLAALEKAELTNVIVVGTRYFGGVKLGIGGLIRAYRSCAEAGVKAARICIRELKARVLLQVPYDYLGAVIREVEAGGGEVLTFNYSQDVALEILLPYGEMQRISERIAGVTRGQAVIKQVAQEFMAGDEGSGV
ncbi:MAG TPA: YigZ family protein [Firmicutes bacterium]|jgi:uncharacterized YigZ family protein|nr:YigZ family protein [Bacillota bacterium]HAA34201.1 YigZ family protein [Bacillota bacterium]